MATTEQQLRAMKAALQVCAEAQRKLELVDKALWQVLEETRYAGRWERAAAEELGSAISAIGSACTMLEQAKRRHRGEVRV